MTIPEELLPLIEWWERDGKKTLVMAAAIAAVILAWQGVKGYRESRRIASGDALVNAESVEELEAAVASYGSTKAGSALKLRLAKAYYDAGSYQSAADIYAEVSASAPKGFEDIPVLGSAECLEGLERFDEAVAAYDAFAEERPDSPLALQAKIGAARAIARSGDKQKALERLAEIKKAVADDDAATQFVENAEDVVKRWTKRENVVTSLEEVAEAATALVAAPEAAPAPAPEAAPAPAPEAAPAPAPKAAPAPAPEAAPAPAADKV